MQAYQLGQIRERIAHQTDQRCSATEELIGAINIVKMYCWESAFLKKIIKFRKSEIQQIRSRNMTAFITQRFVMAGGKFIGIFTFLYYFSITAVENFRSSDIFVVQSFIEDLNWNLSVLFWAVFSFSEVRAEKQR